ncbi:hypothetical protein ABT354_32955 [Streptomyces sp. NPDC000594]|uniref:hypothetical protein n=1 Tax=Streptomyces sp. NPDC000594 TaxID=3154261 RepID=UPI003318FD49
MPTPRNLDSWQQVDSRADFSSYLRFLAFDCERAQGGEGSGAPAALDWTHRSIDGFLWGWVRLLGSRADGTDLLHEEAPGRPGWRGLAHQLDRVRTTPPGYNCVLADSGTRHEEVDTPRDLSMYAATLAMDFARDRREMQERAERGAWAGDGGTWAHGTLHDWLASWASWVGADSPRHAQLSPVTWRSVALQLSVARIYE